MSLRLDWCSHEAAKYAVEHWHYSKCMPMGGDVRIGVWEDNKFIGSVVYGRPPFPSLSKSYKLTPHQLCELQRVALNIHQSQTSRIVSISRKMLYKLSPNLRLIVSFADNEQGHYGGIYQADGWIYTGEFNGEAGVIINGKREHGRTIRHRYGTVKGFEVIKGKKYRYLYPLDDEMRKQIEPLRKPYPKKSCGTGEIDNAAQSNAQTGGASPTVPLLE
jgi:hypothetical protein